MMAALCRRAAWLPPALAASTSAAATVRLRSDGPPQKRRRQRQQREAKDQRGVAAQARRGGRALQEMQSLQEEKAEAAVPEVSKLEWASPLTLGSILRYPDPRLRAVNGRLVAFGEELQKLAAEMMELMYLDDGVGLAAPQVGINVQLMVFNPMGAKGEGQEYILCNPRIISSGKQTDVHEEGCLSVTDVATGKPLFGGVERPLMVKVKAQDENGKKFQLKLEGWEARVFQHEFDHLLGKLHIDTDRMLAEDRQELHAGLQALEDVYAAANPGVEVQTVR